jgi:predicted Zn-dependent peptidase
MLVNETELKNGMRVVHQQVGYSKLSHLGIFINVGSRDEEEDERGVAHFLEHVLFKGTQKRKSFHILNRLDSVGGELNAYTTKEETVIHASVMMEHSSRAMELISDIIFNSVFPFNEIEKEKEVVVDEIQSYMDSPMDMIFEEFELQLFGGHPLGNDILGSEKQVRQITKEKILNFVSKHYVPQNMVISYAGGLSFKKFLQLCERFFGDYEGQSNYVRKILSWEKPVFNQKISKNNHQCHSILGGVAFPYQHDKRLALMLLNNFLGGPAMNSKLNMVVREKHGITYNIESNFLPYRDSGIFLVYYGTEKEQMQKAERLISKEMQKICDKKLGTLQLHFAKQQLIGYLALNGENIGGLMSSLGKSKLIFNKVESLENIIKSIEEISSNQILEIANQIILPQKLSSLTYLTK